MKPVISIIGGTGQMGQFFRKFFQKQGYKVLIAGRKTKLKPEDCANKADVVIVSVPINKTVDVIKKIGNFVKKDSLLMDITSLKKEPVKAMLKYSESEVIGTHPVFGPNVKTIKNQTVILCPARGKKWLKWLRNILERNKAKIKITTAEKHDKMMSVIQGITHFSTVASGYAMKELGMNINESLSYTSPIYKLRMSMIGRILNQDPSLYADIEIQNPENKKTILAYINAAKKLEKIIKNKDREEFIKYFNDSSKFFGKFKKEAEELSDYLIQKMVSKK
jgi:prephenate dehydrogenase